MCTENHKWYCSWSNKMKYMQLVIEQTSEVDQLYSHALTFWCLKKVVKDTQPIPMCAKIWKTFDADPPATSMAMQSRKFPARMAVPGILGWLCQTVTGFSHFGLLQVVVITASVPICVASTIGLSSLHTWQNLNRRSSWERNTMCLGSVRRFVFAIDTL